MNELRRTSARHLHALASYVEDVDHALSTYYRLQPNEGRKKLQERGNNSLADCCPFCNKPFEPGAYITRLNPKPKLTPRLGKLLHKYSDDSGKLGKLQKKLVEDYIEGQNKLVTTCLTCKKRVKHGGQTRIERRRQKKKTARQNTDSSLTAVEKPVTAEERKKERKKEKKKQMKKKRKAGLSEDPHAGLTIPDSLLPPPARLKSEDTTSMEAECSRSADKLTGLETSTPVALAVETSPIKTDSSMTSDKIKNLPAEDSKLKKKSPKHAQVVNSAKDSKAGKAKTSEKLDLEDIIAKKNKAGKGHNSVLSSEGGSVSKYQKKRQLGQQLGLILKQEKSGSGPGRGGTRGSLTDFLSSL